MHLKNFSKSFPCLEVVQSWYIKFPYISLYFKVVLRCFVSVLFWELQGAILSSVAIYFCSRSLVGIDLFPRRIHRLNILAQRIYGADSRFLTTVINIIIRIPKFTFLSIFYNLRSEYLIVSLLRSVGCTPVHHPIAEKCSQRVNTLISHHWMKEALLYSSL